jgi:hypothetical protein
MMVWQIVIDVEAGQSSLPSVHQLRNFGEDLWRTCKADGWSSVSLEDVDRARNQLIVTVRSSRRVRRTVKMISKLFDDHFFTRYAHISEVNIGP